MSKKRQTESTMHLDAPPTAEHPLTRLHRDAALLFPQRIRNSKGEWECLHCGDAVSEEGFSGHVRACEAD